MSYAPRADNVDHAQHPRGRAYRPMAAKGEPALPRRFTHLEAAGIACSMSRRENCWDNAMAESFFGTLKAELMQERDFATRIEAIPAITEYVESFYNPPAPALVAGLREPADVRTAARRSENCGIITVSTKAGQAQRARGSA